eukprot:11223143-Lingulodinium_polyedra.AAC.1
MARTPHRPFWGACKPNQNRPTRPTALQTTPLLLTLPAWRTIPGIWTCLCAALPDKPPDRTQ